MNHWVSKFIENEKELAELKTIPEIQRWIFLQKDSSQLFSNHWEVRKYVNTGDIDPKENDEWNPDKRYVPLPLSPEVLRILNKLSPEEREIFLKRT